MTALRSCIHQCAVLSFKFGFEGVDAIMRLSACTSADRE